LIEETGITAEKLTPIGSLVGEPGMSNQEVFIYVAENLKFGEKNIEKQEIGMHLKHFTFEEIDEAIRNGDIKCGFTLSAILLFRNNFDKQS
jgi:ADP-ribose pyrophosphatase